MPHAVETIRPDDRNHWLTMRLQDVTSTEIAALYGASPYMTEFELWHKKKSPKLVDAEPGERMKWGLILEHAIAQAVAEKHNMEIQPFDVYMRSPEDHMGASFDYVVTRENGKPAKGLIEVKNVDWLIHKRQWDEDEAPAHIEMQAQYQLEVAQQFDFVVIGALVGGNTLHTIRREWDRGMGAAMRERVRQFWIDVDSGTEPEPDYERDAETIIDLLRRSNPETEIDLTKDLEAKSLAEEYMIASRLRTDTEKRLKILKAKLLELIGPAERAYMDGFKVACKEVADTPGKIITENMVGQTIGGRKGYRGFRVTETD